MIIARQSTARTVMVGPVLDADGVAVTGSVVGDFKISKNGGAPAALNGSATLTHRHTGNYSLALTASDLDTVGQAEVTCDDTVNACPIKELTVIEEAVYDISFAASATGAVPVASIAANAITAAATASDFTTEVTSGLATAAELAKVPKSDSNVTWNATALASIATQGGVALATYDPPTNTEMEARTLAAASYATAAGVSAVETDTQDIQSRLPAALVNSRMDATVDGTGMESGAVSAIQSGLATSSALATAQADLDTITGSDGVTLATAQGNYAPATAAALATAQGTIDKLDDTLEDDGGTFRFTANALEEAPSGGGGSSDWDADERTAIRSILGIPASGTTPDDPSTGILDTIRDSVATKASQTSVDDLPTNSELNAALAAADDAVLAAIDALPTAAENRAEMDSNSTQLAAIVADTNELQSDDIPGTLATLATASALSTVDDNVDAILVTTAKLDDTLEDDSGTYRFTENALEEAPSGGGGGPTAGEIADAVWEEALGDHSGTSGSTAEALAAAGGSGDPWVTPLPGAYSAGQAGYIIGTNINATVSSRASQAGVDDLPTNAELNAALDPLPTAAENATAVWGAGARTLTALDEDSTTLDIDAAVRAAVGMSSANLDTQLGDLPTAAEGATAVWAAGTRVLTAGTNIVLAKGTGVTGLNDLSAAQVNAEADQAIADAALATAANLAALDAKVDDLPTNAELGAALDPLPTAGENAAAVLGATVEGAVTVVQSIRLANAALGGKASGLETTEATYRDLADSKDRIVATVDSDGNRTAMTRDLT